METDNSVFKIPEIERQNAYDFEATKKTFEINNKTIVKNEPSSIYEELNAINEEIERCRLRNS